MQLVLEIATLFLIFLLFRQAVVKAFPVHAVGLPISDDSKKALRKYRRRYLVLFWTFGILLSLLFSIGLYELFFQLHASGVEGHILIIERAALLLPSTVLGFLAGTFSARWMNSRMQHDGLSFFFEEYYDEWKGFDTTKVRGWLVLSSIIIASAILYTQYQVYALKSGDEIEWRLSPGKLKKNKLSEVVDITAQAGDEFAIAFVSGDTLLTQKLGGDKVSFINSLKKAPPKKAGH
ncbi:MAG: hypothetical protein RLP14_06575 [Owenweeksia sp.]